MADDLRTLLTPYIIQRELERVAGLPPNSTRLHGNMSIDDLWLLWQVDNRYIRLGPVPANDLRLDLDEFSTKYCEPAVKRRQNGIHD